VNGLDFNLYLGGLHSAYVRGEVLAAAHRYPEAAVEFQKILNHRGIVGADPIGALAHLQLGRAFAFSGDRTKATAAYQDFLALWTLVVAAADPQRKNACSALVSLCEGYWYPLYAYVRCRGYPADQAQDLTQQFFMRVLEGRYLDRADPEKGRFRAFILTSLKF